jgi:hypothetical protein
MIFGNRLSRRGRPGIRLPTPVIWRGLQHRMPERVRRISQRPVKPCSARISCARILFSYCWAFSTLDQRREPTASAKTIGVAARDRDWEPAAELETPPFGPFWPFG